MPRTAIVFYRHHKGHAPVRDWLQSLQWRDRFASAKCIEAIRRLAIEGHELRRPTAAYLRAGIHELRVDRGRVHYRILYFFHGRNVVVLTHGLTKEGVVPGPDMHPALIRKAAYEEDPQAHTYPEGTWDAQDH